MVNFLKIYPVYDQKFSDIWLWPDCPFRHSISPSGKDIGIDLVVLTEDGDYQAIQYKCYKRDAYIAKSFLDSFLGVSGKSFKNEQGQDFVLATRLWISTSINWSAKAENEIKNQTIPFIRLSLFDLESAPVDWELLDLGHHGLAARCPQKPLLPH